MGKKMDKDWSRGIYESSQSIIIAVENKQTLAQSVIYRNHAGRNLWKELLLPLVDFHAYLVHYTIWERKCYCSEQ